MEHIEILEVLGGFFILCVTVLGTRINNTILSFKEEVHEARKELSEPYQEMKDKVRKIQ